MLKYVIKTDYGYVTSHRRGRMTKHLESAKTFKTYHGAKSNRFFVSQFGNARILDVEFNIELMDED